jgi:hypothetical protein
MPALRKLMVAYAQAFLEQVLVSGACNGAHNLGNRLVRWLLMMHDRIDGNTLLITQDLLAEMLGAHRPSITLRELEIAGLIERGRRQITILIARACFSAGMIPQNHPLDFLKTLFLEELRLVSRTQGLGGAGKQQPHRRVTSTAAVMMLGYVNMRCTFIDRQTPGCNRASGSVGRQIVRRRHK